MNTLKKYIEQIFTPQDAGYGTVKERGGEDSRYLPHRLCFEFGICTIV